MQRVILFVFIGINLLFSSALVGKDCNDLLDNLIKEKEWIAANVSDPNLVSAVKSLAPPKRRVFSTKYPSFFKRWLHDKRDRIRSWLQVRNDHPYPVAGLDEAFPAQWWAKQAFLGKRAANVEAEEGVRGMRALARPDLDVGTEQGKEKDTPFDSDSIFKGLHDHLATVRLYHSDMQTLWDGIVNETIKVAAFDGFIEEGSAFHSIDLSWPMVVRSKGGIELAADAEYFGTLEQLKIARKTAVAEIKRLRNELDERVREQAIRIKKIEIYRHQLVKEKKDHEDMEVPPDYAEFLRNADNLYADATGTSLKPEYKPSTWSWQSLKWHQFWVELESVFKRDVRLLKEKYDESQIKKAIEGISEDELKALGAQDLLREGHRYLKRIGFLGNWRVEGIAKFVSAMSVAGFSAWGIPKAIISVMTADEIARRKCAEMKGEEYTACVEERIKSKFSVDLDLAHLQLINDPEGFLPPEIEREIALISGMHNEIMMRDYAMESLKENIHESITEKDKGGDEWRKNMLEKFSDSEFEDLILDPKEGYLAFRYPLVFSRARVRDLAQAAVKTDDAKVREVALDSLKQISGVEILAADLEEILKARYESKTVPE